MGSGEELPAAVERERPDAVVADIRMPPGHHLEGITAAHAIRAGHPGIGVVVLSQHASEQYRLTVISGPGSGTTVRAQLPVQETTDR